VTRADINATLRLVQEFRAELTAMNVRVALVEEELNAIKSRLGNVRITGAVHSRDRESVPNLQQQQLRLRRLTARPRPVLQHRQRLPGLEERFGVPLEFWLGRFGATPPCGTTCYPLQFAAAGEGSGGKQRTGFHRGRNAGAKLETPG